MSEMPFDENMTESIKIGELKKIGLYRYISYLHHILIIEKGWIDATFIQGLNKKNGRNPRFYPKWPHSKCENGSQEQLSQRLPDYTVVAHVQMKPLMQTMNLECCKGIVTCFWYLMIMKEVIE